jgi:hypothetical protein
MSYLATVIEILVEFDVSRIRSVKARCVKARSYGDIVFSMGHGGKAQKNRK